MQRRAKRKLLCRQVEVLVEQISRKEFLSKMLNCSFSFDLITEPYDESSDRRWRLMNEEGLMPDSVGIRVEKYSQIIIFRDKNAFTDIVKANPHMKALFGAEEHEERAFPGLYIAAI